MESTSRIKTLTIGRAPENDITISDHRISRKHAKLEISSGVCTLVDLNSTNGTYVNGSQVSRHSLQPGDRVELAGDVSFQWYKYMPTQQLDHRQTQQMQGRKTQPKGRSTQHLDHAPPPSRESPPPPPPQDHAAPARGGQRRDDRPGMQTQQYLSSGQNTVIVGVILRLILYIITLAAAFEELNVWSFIFMGVWLVISYNIINYLQTKPLQAGPWLIAGMIFYGLTLSIVTFIGVIISYNKIRTVKRYKEDQRY